MRAAGARVLLTGATGGIGRASARALAKAGASLMLTSRSSAALEAAIAAIRAEMPSADLHWQAADLVCAADVAALAEAARAWNVDVLVNNAGRPSFGRFVDLEPAHIEAVLRTNLLAPILLTRALLPWLSSRPRASVIQMGSVLGRLALPGYSVYSAGKFGLRGFSEALRRELAGTAVRVQYLGPRSTRTRFNDAAVLAYNEATHTAMDEPERVARALVELLESGAPERFLGFPESLAVRINGLAPATADMALRAHRRALANAPRAAGPASAQNPAAAAATTRQEPR